MSFKPPNGDVSSVGDGTLRDAHTVAAATAADLARANALLTAEIEERRRTEASLRQSEERFEKAFRSDPDALVISRLSDGAVMEVNHSWEQVVGYEAAEVLGKDRRTLQLVTDGAVRENLLQRLISDGRYQDEEVQLRHRSGAIRDVRISAETIDISGETCVLARLRDITEQKEAERGLAASNERLHMALSAAKMGIWEWIISTDRIIWSPEVGSVFGLAGGEPVDTFDAFLQCIHPEDRPAIARRVNQLVEHPPSDRTYDSEYRAIWPGGEVRWVASKGMFVCDAAGTAQRLLGTVMDITERKQVDERAERALTDFWRRGRIKAVDQMASSVAHELNQPLTAIAIQAGIISSLVSTDERRGSADLALAANQIGEQAHRAGAILRSLRDLVKNRDSHRDLVQLNEVVREVVRIVEALARQTRISLRLELADLPDVSIDRIQIAQLVMNLCQNAIEAMQDRDVDGRVLELATALVDQRAILLSVRDTGNGIPAEIGEGIFDRFFTTRTEGIGIGLAICQSITEAHGGKLWFTSTVGEGTTFFLRLPAADEERE
ncbi:MAG TPA: PAS domain S-box protein [Pirellulales bacterium]|nr:PAS domain S-box protein [Pirellulales bacterium]